MKKLQFHIFGELVLTDGERVLDEKMLHSRQLAQLLACFIIYRSRPLSHDQLISLFCRENSRRPQSALKNLIYRLRSSMVPLGDDTYICTRHKAYQWNPEIEVVTDYEEFEALSVKMQESDNNQHKKAMCLELLKQYGTGISPEIAGEPWMDSWNSHLQELCLNAVQTLCSILEAENDWNGLETLCRKILEKHLYDEKVRNWIEKHLNVLKKKDFSDISSLMADIRKNSRAGKVQFCSYQVFRQIYKIEEERIIRLGLSEYLLLLTVKQGESPPEEKKKTRRSKSSGMDILEGILSRELQEGDVAVRYEPGQFILLLPNATQKKAISIIQRLQKKFTCRAGKKGYTLSCEFGELRSTRQRGAGTA